MQHVLKCSKLPCYIIYKMNFQGCPQKVKSQWSTCNRGPAELPNFWICGKSRISTQDKKDMLISCPYKSSIRDLNTNLSLDCAQQVYLISFLPGRVQLKYFPLRYQKLNRKPLDNPQKEFYHNQIQADPINLATFSITIARTNSSVNVYPQFIPFSERLLIFALQ